MIRTGLARTATSCLLILGALGGCAVQPATPAKETASDAAAPVTATPFPSTYRAADSAPTLIRNATVLTGTGERLDGADVLIVAGKIEALGRGLTLPAGGTQIDASGRWVTPGIIDVHSHLGVYPSPGVTAHQDGNEMIAPVTPNVWAEHAVYPHDPGFETALAGGVTSMLVLPGSGNLIGGRGVVLKNVAADTYQGMKFPGAPGALKIACGENPKRVYGARRQKPSTRMGNVALDRQTWIAARQYQKKRAEGKEQTRNLGLETLADALEGKILVHNHCYRADEMAIVIDMAKEFGYKVTAFHHAVESYKIADLLRENGVCSAMWADWWGFKMESYDAIEENVPLVHSAGACAIVHSDDANQIQRLNQEAAKALANGRRMGLDISEAVAWQWLSYNPARALGIADRTGSLKPGKMADVVLWNDNPFSVYTRPEKVWIDGALLFDANNPARRPVSDFELGQVGEGDVK